MFLLNPNLAQPNLARLSKLSMFSRFAQLLESVIRWLFAALVKNNLSISLRDDPSEPVRNKITPKLVKLIQNCKRAIHQCVSNSLFCHVDQFLKSAAKWLLWQTQVWRFFLASAEPKRDVEKFEFVFPPEATISENDANPFLAEKKFTAGSK